MQEIWKNFTGVRADFIWASNLAVNVLPSTSRHCGFLTISVRNRRNPILGFSRRIWYHLRHVLNDPAHDDAAAMRQMLLDQAYLDDQFVQLEQLEKDDNPNFVRYLFGLYFEDTERYVRTVERCLEMALLDDEDLDRALYHLKGSSASIGANKVKIEVNRLRAMCKEKDVETVRCKEVLQNLKRERAVLKDKMDNYFQLLRNAEPASSADSVVTQE